LTGKGGGITDARLLIDGGVDVVKDALNIKILL
jgi:hypothetical protein